MYYNFKGGIILSIENLDDLIKKYAEALEIMGSTYGGEDTRAVLTASERENESVSQEATTYSDKAKNNENALEMTVETQENTQSENEIAAEKEPADNRSGNEDEQNGVTSSATFSAVVLSGEGTYPVPAARVVVYREDEIYAFLETDENGATKKVSLPAFEEENSLESNNPDRSIDYYADVFAEGFATQRGLLVSSVGGSDILLRVLMVPEGEGIV